MIYHCSVIPLATAPRGPKGFLHSLCDKCKTKDCENPIQYKYVSHIGITEKRRCYIGGLQEGIVVSCDGYME
jgi:hypothetical protein